MTEDRSVTARCLYGDDPENHRRNLKGSIVNDHVIFRCSVKVDVATMEDWPPENKRAFFAGIAEVLSVGQKKPEIEPAIAKES